MAPFSAELNILTPVVRRFDVLPLLLYSLLVMRRNASRFVILTHPSSVLFSRSDTKGSPMRRDERIGSGGLGAVIDIAAVVLLLMVDALLLTVDVVLLMWRWNKHASQCVAERGLRRVHRGHAHSVCGPELLV